MKIAFVCPTPPPYGGITNWSKMLITYLENTSKDQIYVINTSPKTRTADGRTLYDRIFGGLAIAIRASREFKILLKRDSPDIVHVTTSGGLGLFRDVLVLEIARRAKIPAVYHVHYGKIPQTLASGGFEAALLRASLRLCTTAIAIDRATESSIRDTGLCEVVYIGNPVDVYKLKDVCRKARGESKNTVIFLGWVVETKGIRELMDAWDSVSTAFPDWQLTLVGPYDSNRIDALVNKSRHSGVSLVGELSHDEAMERLCKASILVLPSYSEGFPNVVLEAMVYGKAVLATSVGALPDLLGDGRGVLVEPRSSIQISDGLKKLMNDDVLRTSLGERAERFVKENFDIAVVANRYRSLWTRLVSERHLTDEKQLRGNVS